MTGREAIWHDIECGAYTADLPLWRELAGDGSSVLDVGCGTGRVSLDLARAGHDVTALDSDAELLAELERRAAGFEVQIETLLADAREFSLGREVDLVLAPMQLVQLLGGAAGRSEFLACVARALRPGGVFAAALLDLSGEPTGQEYEPPEPDVGKQDGWTYSSLPVGVRVLDRGQEIALDRVRTATAPDGAQDYEDNTIKLRVVDPGGFGLELERAGIELLPRKTIPPTDDHVGSVVVLGRAAP